MQNELEALKAKKPRLLYLDQWSTERIQNEKMIFCTGSVAKEQDRMPYSVPRAPYVELTPELLAVLDSLYPDGFLKPQGG